MNSKSLFNQYWQFIKMPIESSYHDFLTSSEELIPVTLPHDWLIYNTSNLYETSSGWYRKNLKVDDINKKYRLRFEGVYMDSSLYVNDKKIGSWKYGYTTFEMDISKALVLGDNLIVLKVNHQHPNSRWYSGAGIYRNVWLYQTSNDYIKTDDIYISSKKQLRSWQLDIDTKVYHDHNIIVEHQLFDAQEHLLHTSESKALNKASGWSLLSQVIEIDKPNLWSPKQANLYKLVTLLKVNEKVIQENHQKIGFKDIEFHSEKGLFLNGSSIKLHGVCEHHDLGCLGAAFNKSAMRYRLEKLKKMGVNAIRTAHNMPAPELMELTDELGFLVVSEAFDMWESSKNTYDYSRFFKEWVSKDLKSWVKRDRNHVSLCMWSIGNEIHDTHSSQRGQEVTKYLKDMTRSYDYKKNAAITIGSNYMPWENARKCADIVKFAGYNYGEKYYKEHHKEHNDWLIYGSETSSIVQSRGVYHFPLEAPILSEDDKQCSGLGNSATSWGAKSMETCISYDENLEFSLGQFIWTGHDYIGEPTPYETRNAYFGQLDTAGLEKDSYYVYQSAWTEAQDKPMIHIFPYWDFNPGQIIDVRVCTNAAKLDLYLNNLLIGSKIMTNQNPDMFREFLVDFQIPYEKGELKAIAYDEQDHVIASTSRQSFEDEYALKVELNKTTIVANGIDLAFATITVLDQNGNPVENSKAPISVELDGPACIHGMDNGDSTDISEYKTLSKHLFSGKCLCVIGSTLTPGSIKLHVKSPYIKPVSIEFEAYGVELEGEAKNLINSGYENKSVNSNDPKELIIPIRKIELKTINGQKLSPDHPEIEIEALTYPKHGPKQELFWRLVNNKGIDVSYADIISFEQGVRLIGKSDGHFRLRCMVYNGKEHPDIISELEFLVEGFGQEYKDPYEFISSGLYDYSQGQVASGNERGVSTSRDSMSMIGFTNIDFGSFGSDRITMPIFTMSDEAYEIELWQGKPNDQTGDFLGKYIYQKPCIWNVYQDFTCQLPKRLKGITSLSMVTRRKMDIKGFSFQPISKVKEKLTGSDCDTIYGDSFHLNNGVIERIGNNVSISYDDLNFSDIQVDENMKMQVQICGRANKEKNTIVIHISSDNEVVKDMVEFPPSHDTEEKSFLIKSLKGVGKLELIFLPGSDFDLHWIKFS